MGAEALRSGFWIISIISSSFAHGTTAAISAKKMSRFVRWIS